MCEIMTLYHVRGKLKSHELRALGNQAIAGSIINNDGWGFFTSEGQIYKEGKAFHKSDNMNRIYDAMDSRFIVLHLRQATHGKVSQENAHPFTVGNWSLVHNGIISGKNANTPDSLQWLQSLAAIPGNSEIDKLKTKLEGTSGFLSMMILSPSGKLYYVKDNAKFHFGYVRALGLIAGFTVKDRLYNLFQSTKYGVFPGQKYKIIPGKVSENVIYELTGRGIVKRDSWKSPAMVYQSQLWGNGEIQSNYNKYRAYSSSGNLIDGDDFVDYSGI